MKEEFFHPRTDCGPIKGCKVKKRAPEKKDRFVVTATIKNYDFETRFLEKTEIANQSKPQ